MNIVVLLYRNNSTTARSQTKTVTNKEQHHVLKIYIPVDYILIEIYYRLFELDKTRLFYECQTNKINESVSFASVLTYHILNQNK